MKMMQLLAWRMACLAFIGLVSACSPVRNTSQLPSPEVRLYALDCGRIEITMSRFTQGDEYGDRKLEVVAAAFLIRHPKGDLMWDTGLNDAFHDPESKLAKSHNNKAMPFTMVSQLEQLGISPRDIEFLSLSHSHFDHVGNANLFSASTFLVDRDERAHMFREEARTKAEAFNCYNLLEKANTIEFDGDYDVFGDGSVKILAMPGHTPGHTALLLNLSSGPVLLSGDLYHSHEARALRTVPIFNADVEMTLASMQRFEALATELGARVVIQHSLEDFHSLPRFPAYLGADEGH